jgi:SRSO17 transposase
MTRRSSHGSVARMREWLLVEWPRGAPEPIKYWLAHVASQLSGLRRLVRIAKSRWRIELDDRDLKEELGLDHYEGRHWLGWHPHVCLVSKAHAFLRRAGRVKKLLECPCPGEGAPASRAN